MNKKLEAKANRIAKIISKTYGYGENEIFVRPSSWAHDRGYEIVWEGGPYEWAITFAQLAAGYEAIDQEFGFRRRPVKVPTGVFLEPGYSFTLCVNAA